VRKPAYATCVLLLKLDDAYVELFMAFDPQWQRSVPGFLRRAASGRVLRYGFRILRAIPPQVAERLGIPAEKVRRVEEMAFVANDELIGREAQARNAQLALDREIRSASPDETKIGDRVDAMSRAEAAVRKNRIVLMLRVRKVLGDIKA